MEDLEHLEVLCCQGGYDPTGLILGILGALIGALGIFYGGVIQRRQQERNEIYKQLNDLYGPLEQRMGEQKSLYDKLVALLKVRTGNENFRTLTHLLEHGQGGFNENEKAILAALVEIGEEIRTTIIQRGGLVSDQSLATEWFPKLTTHLLILKLAYQGKLIGGSKDFQDKVYPREVDQKVSDQKKKLEKRLIRLRRLF